MRGSPQLFFCLLVAVISGTKAQDDASGSCLHDLRFVYYKTGCTNYDEWITCLEKTMETGEGKFSEMEKLGLTNQLEYYKRRRGRDEPCPVLEDQGTCVDKEMNACHSDFPTSAIDHCSKIQGILSCLMGVNATCSNKAIRHDIHSSLKINVSCESGNMKERMSWERCFNGVVNCTHKFGALYMRNRDYEEARKWVEPSMKCLENVTCPNNQYIRNENSTLNNFMRQYDGGVFSGECSLNPMRKCIAILDTLNATSCSDAKTCLEDLKEHCQTDVQLESYKGYMSRIAYSRRCRDEE